MALVLDKNQPQARPWVALFEPTKLILCLQEFGDYFLLEKRHIGILLLSALKIANPRFLFFMAQSLACRLRNSETLKPAALALAFNLRSSSAVILNSNLSESGLPVFSGRPILRFFIPCLLSWLCTYKSQGLFSDLFPLNSGPQVGAINEHGLLAIFYHLAALRIVPVFGAVVLCFVNWRDKVIKFNVEIKADALFASEGRVNGRPHQGNAFQLMLCSTKKVPKNWDSLLLDLILSGKQAAAALQLAGRKPTFIVDSRNQIITRGEFRRLLLTFVDPDSSSKFRKRLGDVEAPRLAGNHGLPVSQTVADPQTEQAG